MRNLFSRIGLTGSVNVKLHGLTAVASFISGFRSAVERNPEPESQTSALFQAWLSGEWVKNLFCMHHGRFLYFYVALRPEGLSKKFLHSGLRTKYKNVKISLACITGDFYIFMFGSGEWTRTTDPAGMSRML